MFNKEQFEVLKKLVDTFGNKQINICIEEMSELTKELCKHNRGANNYPNIIEEIADVYITLKQVEILFKIEREEIYEEINYKIKRVRDTVLERFEMNEWKIKWTNAKGIWIV